MLLRKLLGLSVLILISPLHATSSLSTNVTFLSSECKYSSSPTIRIDASLFNNMENNGKTPIACSSCAKAKAKCDKKVSTARNLVAKSPQILHLLIWQILAVH